MIAFGPTEERALIFTCTHLVRSINLQAMASAGINNIHIPTLDALDHALAEGVGVLIIEAPSQHCTEYTHIRRLLKNQPRWSHVPVIVLLRNQSETPPPLALLSETLDNATFMGAPCSPATLHSVAKSALRARRLQYKSRDNDESLEREINRRVNIALQEDEALRQAQKMEAVGQLTAGIAHDFNNLLTGIIGSLELMRQKLARGKADDLDRLIDMGVTSANRAAGLTHRLLAFSRRQSLDSKPVAINDWLSAQHAQLQHSLGKSIALSVETSDLLWIAEVDACQLENALLHLVSNARDAMPLGGQLKVKCFNRRLNSEFCAANPSVTPGDYIVIRVCDTGCGMNQHTLKRVYDPFFTTKPIGQGTGLGLSMIYGFCKQSRGHVHIDSEECVGTTVELFIPRFNGNTDFATVPGPSITQPATNADKTLLIVEDDVAIRKLAAEVLLEQGYQVIEAQDASSALPIIESSQSIDLLISDVGLPGMNGRQLAEICRQCRPQLNVLFITGYAQHATARSVFLDEGMQLITKPFTFELLKTKVNEMLLASEHPHRP